MDLVNDDRHLRFPMKKINKKEDFLRHEEIEKMRKIEKKNKFLETSHIELSSQLSSANATIADLTLKLVDAKDEVAFLTAELERLNKLLSKQCQAPEADIVESLPKNNDSVGVPNVLASIPPSIPQPSSPLSKTTAEVHAEEDQNNDSSGINSSEEWQKVLTKKNGDVAINNLILKNPTQKTIQKKNLLRK